MQSDVLHLESGAIDLRSGRTARGAQLGERERALLAWLAARPGRDVCRSELLVKVWGFHENVVTRTIDVTMRRLREKVEATPSEPRHLITVHGVGYRFVPLRAEPLPGRVVAPSGRLVGREDCCEQLRTWWRDGGRMLTLWGPPGAGKTRLAEAFAGDVQRDHAVWFCDASPFDPPLDLVLDMARDLGLQPHTEEDAIHRVGVALRERAVDLLVLDDPPPAVEWVHAWLAAAPQLRIIVTTQQATGLRSEARLRVEGLPMDAAVALLNERASVDIAPELAHPLLERLDRLPLAIELVATRLGLMEADRVHDTLDEHALELPLERSWRFLDPESQRTLWALSLFRGGFTLDDVQALLQTPSSMAELTRLQRASLLHARGRPGRLALYASVRGFAAQQLPAEERQTLHERFAAMWLTPMVGLGEPREENHWGPPPIQDEPNLRHALRLAQDPVVRGRLGLLLATTLPPFHATDRVLAVLDAAWCDDAPPVLRGRMLTAKANLALTEARMATCLEGLAQAAPLLGDDPRWQAWHAVLRGVVVARTGDVPGGRALLEASVPLLAEHRWDRMALRGGFALAMVLRAAGQTAASDAALDAVETLVVRLADPEMEAKLLVNRAYALIHRGHHGDELPLFDEALGICRRHGLRRVEAQIVSNLATGFQRQLKLDEAATLHAEAQRLLRDLGLDNLLAVSLQNLSIVERRRGQLVESERLSQRALALHRMAGEHWSAVPVQLGLGITHLMMGRVAEAAVELEACAASTGQRRESAMAWTYRAAAARLAGDDPEPHLQRALDADGDALVQAHVAFLRGGPRPRRDDGNVELLTLFPGV